ncbi:hypothetical protein B0H16DRAFT_1317884 [Mycena metata]|uniref:AN1-type domain-containing protein n=1 Tax=Mycena metata TaxID=1033252 RepID=A0AAD7IWV2_9AGAR|nr:hypothetical protein B0H16DRAFT_1317884 [Mycena metata]
MIEIGSQCSQPLCKEIDFLPIFCRCQLYFCRSHSSADAHNCTWTKTTQPLPAGPSAPLQRCAADKCSKPSLEAFVSSADAEGRTPATCPHCNASFCCRVRRSRLAPPGPLFTAPRRHRHPKSHSCNIKPTVEPKNEAARALLAKNFPSTSKGKTVPVRRVPKIPTDPVKLAQFRKLELMKMRHSAVPVEPKVAGIPQEDRLHIKVALDDGSEKVFWARKSLGTGRVLDLLANQLGISSSDTSPLELFKIVGEERIKCRNDQLFSNEVEEASTVVVSRCTQLLEETRNL